MGLQEHGSAVPVVLQWCEELMAHLPRACMACPGLCVRAGAVGEQVGGEAGTGAAEMVCHELRLSLAVHVRFADVAALTGAPACVCVCVCV